MTRIPIIASFLAAVGFLTSLSDHAIADDPADFARAKEFWNALARGDTHPLESFYAPKVLLKAGSELLKQQWGVAKEADRSKDVLVKRTDLLRGYERMIDRIGKERWSKVFTQIQDDKIQTSTATRDGQPFAGVKRGDTILKVATGPGDDTLHFILRKDDNGQLLVHVEATDY